MTHYLWNIKNNKMPSKLILSMLRVSVSIMYYLLLIYSVVFVVASILSISGNNQGNQFVRRTFSYKVVAMGSKNTEPPSTYSSDNLVRYHPIQNHFTVEVEPNSVIGYYAFISHLIFILLGIGVLWIFKKILKETNLDHPFRSSITRGLKILAALFIISDILRFIDYLSFNSLLHQSVSSPRFQLLTDVGGDLITGLIIFVISIIYQRGTALQEETALTV
jgi:hypothetical protein